MAARLAHLSTEHNFVSLFNPIFFLIQHFVCPDRTRNVLYGGISVTHEDCWCRVTHVADDRWSQTGNATLVFFRAASAKANQLDNEQRAYLLL